MEEMKDEGKERDRWSERAPILARVLDWVDQRNFEDHGSWMMLGSMGSAQVQFGDEPPVLDVYQRHSSELEPIQQALVDLDTELGRYHAAKRMSLIPPRINIPGPLSPMLKELEGAQPLELGPSDVAEYLDAKYSREILTKLEKIVKRAALLDPHEVDSAQIGSKNVRGSFDQAHHCYLYGFHAGCAVLCRATLEAALKSKFDPLERIKQGLRKGESPITKLLERAKLGEPLEGWTNDVRTAGGRAVHDYDSFCREYESRMPEILAKTRGVLTALYPKDA
jgi:hypothetical protein